MLAENRDAGSPNDAATAMVEKGRANLASAETLKGLLPADVVMSVFVTKTDDDDVVLAALQDTVIESLVVQFLGCGRVCFSVWFSVSVALIDCLTRFRDTAVYSDRAFWNLEWRFINFLSPCSCHVHAVGRVIELMIASLC